MADHLPSTDILRAFGLAGEPVLLPGGQGKCWRAGDAVLKPVKDAVEASWLAEINEGLNSPDFRVPKFRQDRDGAWVHQGWVAYEYLPGEHRPLAYREAVALSKVFQAALKDVPKPAWFDGRTDVFALADKMAWGELPLPDYEPARATFNRIFGRLRENHLPNQLVHGDWGPGQLLFHDTLPPAVLDMTPYFRPADYPIADSLLGAVQGELGLSALDLGRDIPDFDQLLLRVLVFRTCTYIGFQLHPENNHDWTPTIDEHLVLAEEIMKE